MKVFIMSVVYSDLNLYGDNTSVDARVVQGQNHASGKIPGNVL